MIEELMGTNAVLQILNSVRALKQQTMTPDMLIWYHGKSGRYSVKEGYAKLKSQHLTIPTYEDNRAQALKKIWTWKGLVPKVRLFLWRAI